VRAWDDSAASVSDTFDVVVRRINKAPVVSTSFADTTVAEEFIDTLKIPLAGHFSDPDGQIDSIRVSGDSTLVHWTVQGNVLRVTSVASQFGTERFVVRAWDDSAASVSDTFQILVQRVNKAPILVTPFRDTVVSKTYTGTTLIRLGSHFADPDGAIASIEVLGDSTFFHRRVIGDSLLLTVRASVLGSDQLVVRARDNDGASVSDTFLVTLTSPVSIVTRTPAGRPSTGPVFRISDSIPFRHRIPDIGDHRLSLGFAKDASLTEGTSSEVPFVATQAGTLEVSIFDLTGAWIARADMEIGSADIRAGGTGRRSVYWNQRDSRGDLVPSGIYLWKIVFVSSTGERFETVRKVGVGRAAP